VILAFISLDFLRMLSSEFKTYPKPRLIWINDCLKLEQFPVPLKQDSLLEGLATVQLVKTVIDHRRAPPTLDDSMPLAEAVIDHVAALAAARGSKLLLVHLPTWGDRTARPVDAFRLALRAFALKRGIAHLDLIEAFRALPQDAASSMHFTTDFAGLPYSRGHMTVAGNAFVADEVWKAVHALQQGPAPLPPSLKQSEAGCL
jgi:hypothetical protein